MPFISKKEIITKTISYGAAIALSTTIIPGGSPGCLHAVCMPLTFCLFNYEFCFYKNNANMQAQVSQTIGEKNDGTNRSWQCTNFARPRRARQNGDDIARPLETKH